MKVQTKKGNLVGKELEELIDSFGMVRVIFPESVYKDIVVIAPKGCLVVVDDVEVE